MIFPKILDTSGEKRGGGEREKEIDRVREREGEREGGRERERERE